MVNWASYLPWRRDQVLERLAIVQQDIANLHTELAFAKQCEVEAKSTAWQNSPEGSVTGRERDARLSATPHTMTILDLEGKRAALEEEKSFLLLLEP